MWQLKPVCPQINAVRGASKRALALGKQATYCVYAIVDPSCPDSRFKGGRPIYVGRTDDLYQRIRNHVGAAKRANPNGIGIAATLRRLLDAGYIPVFEHIASCGGKIESYQWEAVWIERLMARGYSLENRCRMTAAEDDLPGWQNAKGGEGNSVKALATEHW